MRGMLVNDMHITSFIKQFMPSKHDWAMKSEFLLTKHTVF